MADSSPMSVLVVDDDPDVLEMVVFQVRRLGHDVSSTTSIEQARAVLDPSTVGAVVTDLHFGSATCESLVRACEAVGVRTIVHTSSPADAARLFAGTRGVVVLAKPASMEDLAQALG